MIKRIEMPQSIDENARVEDLRFIFNQARDKVLVLTEDAEKLYQRSVLLTSLCITLITAIIGYIGSNLSFNFASLLLGTIAAFLSLSLVTLRRNLLPTNYWGIGSDPIALATDPFFTNLEGKTPEWHLLYAEIVSFQERIEINRSNNFKRAERISEAIAWFYRIPLISITILLISFMLGLI